MNIRRRWHSLDFYWKLYIISFLSFGTVITIIENIIDPIINYRMLPPEALVYYKHIDNTSGFELISWLVGIVFPSFLIGGLVVFVVRKLLNEVVETTKKLADGDLSARVPEFGSGKDVFANLTQHFNRMADSLQRLYRNERRMIADISHELRSPITRMELAATILENSEDRDELKFTFGMLKNDIEHMNNLITVLLIQGCNRAAELGDQSEIDVTELLVDMADKFNVLGQDKHKSFITEVDSELFIYGYETRLRMAVENVLSNALFYMPSDSETSIRGYRQNGSVVIQITDSGPGVPDGDLESIFHHFFRSDSSRDRKSGGVGLGLAIVKESVELNNGSVRADNASPGLCIAMNYPCCSEAI